MFCANDRAPGTSAVVEVTRQRCLLFLFYLRREITMWRALNVPTSCLSQMHLVRPAACGDASIFLHDDDEKKKEEEEEVVDENEKRFRSGGGCAFNGSVVKSDSPKPVRLFIIGRPSHSDHSWELCPPVKYYSLDVVRFLSQCGSEARAR